MSAGADQVIVGVDFTTLIVVVAVAVVKFTASVGVKITDSWFAPAFSTVPAAGSYTNEPATLAVAFSCVALSAVPYAMSAGADQVIAGVAFSTLIATVFVAPLKFTASVGVKVTESVWPAPALSTLLAAGEYTNVPGTLAVALSCVAPSAVP